MQRICLHSKVDLVSFISQHVVFAFKVEVTSLFVWLFLMNSHFLLLIQSWMCM